MSDQRLPVFQRMCRNPSSPNPTSAAVGTRRPTPLPPHPTMDQTRLMTALVTLPQLNVNVPPPPPLPPSHHCDSKPHHHTSFSSSSTSTSCGPLSEIVYAANTYSRSIQASSALWVLFHGPQRWDGGPVCTHFAFGDPSSHWPSTTLLNCSRSSK